MTEVVVVRGGGDSRWGVGHEPFSLLVVSNVIMTEQGEGAIDRFSSDKLSQQKRDVEETCLENTFRERHVDEIQMDV